MSTVSSNHVQMVDSSLDNTIYNFVFIETTSRTAKDCPSLVLQVSDELLVEFDPVVLA